MHFLSYAAMGMAETVWDTIEVAFEVKRSLLEETMTDLSLLDMAQAVGTQVIITDYSKAIENRDGGDWAWCFLFPSGRAVAFRVQAKIMQMKRPNHFDWPDYRQLHYSPKVKPPALPYSPGEQTRRLIASSKRDRMFPLYCLFTAHSGRFVNKSKCVYSANGLTKGFGMAVVGAEVIDSLTPTQISFDDFSSEVHALPCLFEEALHPKTLAAYCLNRWPMETTLSDLILNPDELREIPVLAAYFAGLDLGRLDSVQEVEPADFLPEDVDRLTVFGMTRELDEVDADEIALAMGFQKPNVE